MIKTKKITIPAQKSKVVERQIYVCDLCGRENIDRSFFVQCSMCGRLVCRGGYGRTDKCHCMYDPDEIGDYPAEFCQICYNLRYEKYANDFEKIEEDYSNKIDNMESKIKAESIATKV
jgi:hypothetical protein